MMGTIVITLGPSEPPSLPPPWAFWRVEQERCAARGLVPNPLNVEVVMRNPDGWPDLHAWAGYIWRTEGGR